MDLTFWNSFNNLTPYLKATENILINNLSIKNKDFKKAISNIIHGNGKMIRSVLLLIFAQTNQKNTNANKSSIEKDETAAAAVEMLHLASLVHDDIIDEANIRRGVSTLNQKFGNKNALYLGDFLFTQYFHLLSSYSKDLKNVEETIAKVKLILFGELEQNQTINKTNRSKNEYLEAVKGKTGELFSLSTKEGAKLNSISNPSPTLAEKIGEELGIAYQIQDDLLNISPNSDTGKPNFNDIKEGVYTLPIIETINSPIGKDLKEILNKEELNNKDLNNIVKIITKSNGIKKTKDEIEKHLNLATILINLLPSQTLINNLNHLINLLFSQSLSIKTKQY